jgi:protein involved in polysaccharide export with SLBB domain
MAGNLSIWEPERAIEQKISRELIDPSLTITPVAIGPQKASAGGEVKSPGVFELPGTDRSPPGDPAGGTRDEQ